MTDIERFVELYRSLGIECVINQRHKITWPLSFDGVEILMGYDLYSPGGETTESDKFFGYSGLYTCVRFDNNGKFISQGFF
jgi:hypothetical protein